MEIIPAIIAKNFYELKAKIKLVETCVKTVQLDVMDGVFVNNKTWPYFKNQSIADLDNFKTSLFLEAHLMVEKPEEILDDWLASPADRIVVHWEAIKEIFHPAGDRPKGDNLIKKAHQVNKEFGIALNPATPIEILDSFISDLDLVLLMSVEPGFAGQEFKEEVIPKIVALQQRYPGVRIEVDGGVNPQNILKLAEAGIDFLVMGSAIFSTSEPCSLINLMVKNLKGR